MIEKDGFETVHATGTDISLTSGTQTPDTSAEALTAIDRLYLQVDQGCAAPDASDLWDEVTAIMNENEALAADNARLRAERDELPWRPKDIRRGLILFRTSSNAHGFTNYQALTGKIDALPDAAKDELAAIMVNMALGYSRDNVRQNGMVQQWIAQARDNALEEAACLADPDDKKASVTAMELHYLAADIRALKGDPQ